MNERVSIFGDTDFSVSGFAPKKEDKTNKASPEAVRAVSENADFRSREPAPAKKQKPAAREPRHRRTGRNVQFNLKVRQEALDAFYEIADRENWVLGETFENAVAALKRELALKPTSKA
jgi:hypothetical protein